MRSVPEPVALAADGLDDARVVTELVAQPAQVNLDDIGAPVLAAVKHSVAQLGARDRSTPGFHQAHQQLALAGGQGDIPAAKSKQPVDTIQVHRSPPKTGKSCGPEGARAKTRDELDGLERLGYEVVRPRLEQRFPLCRVGADREDGLDVAGFPQASARGRPLFERSFRPKRNAVEERGVSNPLIDQRRGYGHSEPRWLQ